jgi:hypothetical protein
VVQQVRRWLKTASSAGRTGRRPLEHPNIGIALIPDHGDTPADLKRADIALYRQDSGRNTIQLFRNTSRKRQRTPALGETTCAPSLLQGESSSYASNPGGHARNSQSLAPSRAQLDALGAIAGHCLSRFLKKAG